MNPDQHVELVAVLEGRFKQHMARHSGISWAEVAKRLATTPKSLESLHQMEKTGGEPDVIGHDSKTGGIIFCDCSAETPDGRRSVCYDRKALDSRKEHKPANNAVDMAAAMGISLLTEEQYREFQKLGDFDLKTSSWVVAPPEIRELGGGIFCDKRYGRVFTYHNGPQSYYATRGFRGLLIV